MNLFNFFMKPEDKVFSVLRKCGEKEREGILKEMIFQWIPKQHLHLNPRRQKRQEA
jgi:hypothetical protein